MSQLWNSNILVFPSRAWLTWCWGRTWGGPWAWPLCTLCSRSCTPGRCSRCPASPRGTPACSARIWNIAKPLWQTLSHPLKALKEFHIDVQNIHSLQHSLKLAKTLKPDHQQVLFVIQTSVSMNIVYIDLHWYHYWRTLENTYLSMSKSLSWMSW